MLRSLVEHHSRSQAPKKINFNGILLRCFCRLLLSAQVELSHCGSEPAKAWTLDSVGLLMGECEDWGLGLEVGGI